MTSREQLEAWVEKRIIERTATRREVYALRRFRRGPSQCSWTGVVDAVLAAQLAPFFKALQPTMRAVRQAAEAMNGFVMRWNAALIEHSDLGEFDNRAHDWLRERPR